VEDEAVIRDLLHRVHGACLLCRVTDQRSVDAVRRRVAERKRVRRDEQRAHRDRQGCDEHRRLHRRPTAPAQARYV
jgi:hypothetical protein